MSQSQERWRKIRSSTVTRDEGESPLCSKRKMHRFSGRVHAIEQSEVSKVQSCQIQRFPSPLLTSPHQVISSQSPHQVWSPNFVFLFWFASHVFSAWHFAVFSARYPEGISFWQLPRVQTFARVLLSECWNWGSCILRLQPDKQGEKWWHHMTPM